MILTTFASAIIIAAALALLGVFVHIKRMSFFSDGIAHASLAGIAIGLLAHVNPLWTALGIGILFALLLFAIEKKTNISPDAGIGILFTTGMALGVALLSRGGASEEMMEDVLFGDILDLTNHTALLIGAIGIGIMIVLGIFARPLTLLVLDRDEAWLKGTATNALELSLYIVLAIATVLGSKLLGILLVSALLIIPAASAKLFARSFRVFVTGSLVVGVVIMSSGLLLAERLAMPPGAVVILTGTVLFGILFIMSLPLSGARKT